MYSHSHVTQPWAVQQCSVISMQVTGENLIPMTIQKQNVVTAAVAKYLESASVFIITPIGVRQTSSEPGSNTSTAIQSLIVQQDVKALYIEQVRIEHSPLSHMPLPLPLPLPLAICPLPWGPCPCPGTGPPRCLCFCPSPCYALRACLCPCLCACLYPCLFLWPCSHVTSRLHTDDDFAVWMGY